MKKINEEVDVHNFSGAFDLIKEKRDVLNKVSPTFCLAKWLQSTVLLQNGETHSCHHPGRHKIQVADIIDNPAGIHNTPIKLIARDEMLDGIQTKECRYCWNIENLKEDYVSDRIYKSSFSWSWPHLQKVLDSGVGADIEPTYLEVSFENTCNFKCLYCGPESSSRWQDEVDKHGGIGLTKYKINDPIWLKEINKWPIRHDEYNPYVEAFWKWWPTLYPNLHTFRITGGEPLLSKYTWKVLDYIKANPRKDLLFAINTNMNAPIQLQEKLLTYIRDIGDKIKGFHIYTSLENTGEQAEYVRHGLEYEQFLKNCKTVLDSTGSNVELNIMTTINVLSAPTFLNFLQLMKKFKEDYQISKHDFRVKFRVNYLRWPECLNIILLSKQDKIRYAKEWLEFVEANAITKEKHDWQTFLLEDVDQVKRLCDYMLSTNPTKNDFDDFRTFISTCDSRRNTNFSTTFPELTYLTDNNYYGDVNEQP